MTRGLKSDLIRFVSPSRAAVATAFGEARWPISEAGIAAPAPGRAAPPTRSSQSARDRTCEGGPALRGAAPRKSVPAASSIPRNSAGSSAYQRTDAARPCSPKSNRPMHIKRGPPLRIDGPPGEQGSAAVSQLIPQ